ncbi:hypothetical protein MTO96_042605 [Rhipicephalus appendiculatus]
MQFRVCLHGVFPDLLATSGDYLRVWRAGEDTRLECLLNNNKNSDFCAPLTSFDWNEVDPNLLGTSSIDTTCTIWGLETGQVVGRAMAGGGAVSGPRQDTTDRPRQGGVRHRILSGGEAAVTCLPASVQTGRCGCSTCATWSTRPSSTRTRNTSRYCVWPGTSRTPTTLATFAMDACEVIILDVRVPCTPCGAAQQPPGMRQWHRLGSPLVMPHLHSRGRPPGSDLGHPADAAGNRRPHLGILRV